MTYQQIIETISGTCLSHYFINSFNSGNLSDIQMGDDSPSVLYPHAFLIPQNLSSDKSSSTFAFQLILMTKTYETETENIKAQSELTETLYEIMGQLDNYDDDFYMSNNFTLTPFKEAYKDVVVGTTLSTSIRFKKPFDICNAPSAGTPSSPTTCPQVLVIDGDETDHYVDAGGTYTCLPATPKSGIFYQRVIPWQGFDTSSIVGSVEWHRQQGTYNFLYPQNPEYIAQRNNGYFGNDNDCLLLQDNKFGNRFRYTNDIGEQYTEGFDEDPNNNSENPRLCLDHLTGLMIFVWDAYDTQGFTWDFAIRYSNDFTYGGYTDWRSGDIGEFLQILDFSDWNNAWNAAYTPWMNPNVRNYGGSYVFGCRDRDGFYLSTRTNGPTIQRTTNAASTYDHNLMVRNFS